MEKLARTLSPCATLGASDCDLFSLCRIDYDPFSVCDFGRDLFSLCRIDYDPFSLCDFGRERLRPFLLVRLCVRPILLVSY